MIGNLNYLYRVFEHYIFQISRSYILNRKVNSGRTSGNSEKFCQNAKNPQMRACYEKTTGNRLRQRLRIRATQLRLELDIEPIGIPCRVGSLPIIGVSIGNRLNSGIVIVIHLQPMLGNERRAGKNK